jgi:hypothetical protein
MEVAAPDAEMESLFGTLSGEELERDFLGAQDFRTANIQKAYKHCLKRSIPLVENVLRGREGTRRFRFPKRRGVPSPKKILPKK